MGQNDRHDDVENPKGVGDSDLRRGEDIVKEEGKEPGRFDTGKKGPASRPQGKSTPRDQTGISPSKST